MRRVNDGLLIAPTDLATFIGCRHRTGLDLAVAHHVLERPRYEDPYAMALRRRGEEHERRYVDSLGSRGLSVAAIDRQEGPATPASLARQTDDTLSAMRSGKDVIVQARLAHGEMAGYADILMRVETPSQLGAWSYEAQDAKLARDTRGGAILQLCAYSELLAHMQGTLPECFQVVTPDPDRPVHTFRTADYLAYYRMVRAAFEASLRRGHEALRADHYPEPVEHCAVCAWELRCIGRRRADDHLSFIAGSGRAHRQELVAQGYPSLSAAATMRVPAPFRPSRGSRETYDRLGHQARLQHQQRTEDRPVFERLAIAPGEGLARLPEPSAGDLFLDLEGARFAREGGREFLFGVFARDSYRAWWAIDDIEEKRGFEEVMDAIVEAWCADPGMHVYHFNHYEPTGFKKLVGRHVTRADALDELLRAERFVDLLPIVRQAVRCGVESYSIKQLEQYYAFERRVALANARQPLMAVELALEAGTADAIDADMRGAVQGYNEDDCRSTEALRGWLESVRDQAVAEGAGLVRPVSPGGEAPAAVSELRQEVDRLRSSLLAGLPAEASAADHPEHARWLMAYLIDWHRREENASWWDYYRLIELPDEELLDEGGALTGLRYVEDVEMVTNKRTGKPTGSVIRRFAYPPQQVEIGRRGGVVLRNGEPYGSIEAHDRNGCTVDLKSKVATYPAAVFLKDVVKQTEPQRSVMRLAERMLRAEVGDCGLALVRRQVPATEGEPFEARPGETPVERAVRLVTHLSGTVLPIQGPPGAGKTFTGARMILELVRAGKRVGITATGHKVIVNLMGEVLRQARAAGVEVSLGRKPGDGEDGDASPFALYDDNNAALEAVRSGAAQVFGGTAWLWSRQEFAGAVDVLFVDEAGQMSLANALATSQAADSLVLLGDPQQLDQPQKATHPDGVGISALEHVLGGAETMPEDRGLFLPTTYRMAPAITAFTSELFYEGRLQSKAGLERQQLRRTGRFDGAGLWLVPVVHDGNQNASAEEAEAVGSLVQALLAPEWSLTAPNEASASGAAAWIDEHQTEHPLEGRHILVVAPFNAQVNRLAERLAALGVRVGTVDKFQGQEAPVVIYSMATSRPEDAPRGMEFLYSLNRLNVATSRARCAVFVVCSPRLLEPDCRTPRQMHLANALCRYAELAR